MSNRTALYWTTKLKPVVKGNSRTKRAGGVSDEAETIEELATPIKSLTDRKKYKTIRLRNGLTALLISDLNADPRELADCALSVNVGSYSDPLEIQGLAHFVEHMLFLGSEMYPVENQFKKYVVASSGTSNAVTSRETSTFYFEIGPRNLLGAMKMMSQFFISPLMYEEAMQRELEAVDSEFADKVLSETRRASHLLTCMFPRGHPYSKFKSGNLKSLRDGLNNDTQLHCTAKNFRVQHYTANRMTVAVKSSVDISELEGMVVEAFGPIPSSASQPDDFSRFAYSADTLTAEFRSLYYVKPVTDASEIRLTWCVRSLLSEYESKPLHYIGFLLRYKGKGSLFCYLQQKIWALNIEVKNSDDGLGYSSINTFFYTRIQLTKDGLEHLDEVIEAVFSYLDMLRRVGPNERIYNDMKKIADNKFYFIRSLRPLQYIKNLAWKMHIYPPEHYITGDQLYFKYNPTVIKQVLDSLRANNVNVRVLSNKHANPIQYNMKEDLYGIEYRREAIPQEWLRRWMNVAAYSEFQIPEKNVYITNDFRIGHLETPYVESAKRLGLDLANSTLHDIWIRTAKHPPETKTFRKNNLIATINNFSLGTPHTTAIRLYKPNLFFKSSHMEVWYKPELKFHAPIAFLYFYFILPLSLQTPKELCLLDLWGDVVQQGLKDEIYRASLADLSHSIYIQNKGVLLHVKGYNQNLHLLVDATTNGMRTATEALTQKMFEAVREMRARNYHNNLIKASLLSEYVLMEILRKPYISPRLKAAWINKVTLKDLQDFDRRVLKKMYMQVLIQGNIPWYQAVNIAKKVHSDLNWEGLPLNEQPELKVHQLPLGERRVRVMSLNKFSTSSIVTNYYQGEVYTAKENVLLFHLAKMMKPQLFNTLRTKEQLGYTVLDEARSTYGIQGFSISVHTHVNKYSVQKVEERIEAFLNNYIRELLTLTPSACNLDYNLLKMIKAEESLEKEWAADDALKMSDLIDWMSNHFASGNKSMFRKLSVQIEGHKKNVGEAGPSQMTDYQLAYLKPVPGENASEYITNIENFTKNLPLMQVPKFLPA